MLHYVQSGVSALANLLTNTMAVLALAILALSISSMSKANSSVAPTSCAACTRQATWRSCLSPSARHKRRASEGHGPCCPLEVEKAFTHLE